MSKVYDPKYHMNIVRNLRFSYKEKYGEELTRFSDKWLYDYHCEWSPVCENDSELLEMINEEIE